MKTFFEAALVSFAMMLSGCAGHVVASDAPVELLVRIANLRANTATFRVAHSYAEIEALRPTTGKPGEDWAVEAVELDTSNDRDNRAPWFKPGQGLDQAQCPTIVQ